MTFLFNARIRIMTDDACASYECEIITPNGEQYRATGNEPDEALARAAQNWHSDASRKRWKA